MPEMYLLVAEETERRLYDDYHPDFCQCDYYPETDRYFVYVIKNNYETTSIISGVSELLRKGCSSKELSQKVIRERIRRIRKAA